jgi:H+/Cl- antiporter ClcA
LFSIKKLLRHPYALGMIAHLSAAMVTGVACVLFARCFEWCLARRWDLSRVGDWSWLLMPAGFLLSVELIRRLAPFAAGTGIPQAMFAGQHMTRKTEPLLFPMVSLRTMAVKIASLLIAVMAGASTGREGPTVHVAVCVFAKIISPRSKTSS